MYVYTTYVNRINCIYRYNITVIIQMIISIREFLWVLAAETVCIVGAVVGMSVSTA